MKPVAGRGGGVKAVVSVQPMGRVKGEGTIPGGRGQGCSYGGVGDVGLCCVGVRRGQRPGEGRYNPINPPKNTGQSIDGDVLVLF